MPLAPRLPLKGGVILLKFHLGRGSGFFSYFEIFRLSDAGQPRIEPPQQFPDKGVQDPDAVVIPFAFNRQSILRPFQLVLEF